MVSFEVRSSAMQKTAILTHLSKRFLHGETFHSRVQWRWTFQGKLLDRIIMRATNHQRKAKVTVNSNTAGLTDQTCTNPHFAVSVTHLSYYRQEREIENGIPKPPMIIYSRSENLECSKRYTCKYVYLLKLCCINTKTMDTNGGNFGWHLWFFGFCKLWNPLEKFSNFFPVPLIIFQIPCFIFWQFRSKIYEKFKLWQPFWTPSWIFDICELLKPFESAFNGFLVPQTYVSVLWLLFWHVSSYKL